jgi:hypothetical protein
MSLMSSIDPSLAGNGRVVGSHMHRIETPWRKTDTLRLIMSVTSESCLCSVACLCSLGSRSRGNFDIRTMHVSNYLWVCMPWMVSDDRPMVDHYTCGHRDSLAGRQLFAQPISSERAHGLCSMLSKTMRYRHAGASLTVQDQIKDLHSSRDDFFYILFNGNLVIYSIILHTFLIETS